LPKFLDFGFQTRLFDGVVEGEFKGLPRLFEMNGREVIGQTRFIAVVANDCAADDHASSFSDHDELIVGVEVMPVDLLRDLLCGEIGKQNVPSFMLLRRQARDVVLLGRTSERAGLPVMARQAAG
jgi:hypothetical protein